MFEVYHQHGSGVTGVNRRFAGEHTSWPLGPMGAERSFAVGSRTWSVCEVVDPTTQKCVLIFTSVGVGRRVRRFPLNWRDLSAKELEALSWSR